MNGYDKIIINAFYLETPAKAALDSGKYDLEFAIQYSQAISMKRVADSMQRQEKRIEEESRKV